MLTVPALIFSPLGEEIFFRGVLQQAAEERWTHRTALIVDAGWFAAVHLFHHGIVRIEGEVRILLLSGAIWMLLIFCTGVLFAYLRQKNGSLPVPILSRAAFNLTMNFTILYRLGRLDGAIAILDRHLARAHRVLDCIAEYLVLPAALGPAMVTALAQRDDGRTFRAHPG
jgi:membrane protease YdiL (CAAX protease family)